MLVGGEDGRQRDAARALNHAHVGILHGTMTMTMTITMTITIITISTISISTITMTPHTHTHTYTKRNPVMLLGPLTTRMSAFCMTS